MTTTTDVANPHTDNAIAPRSGFVRKDGRELFEIHRLDTMAPFLMTVVGDTDLWMYISSAGSFTAGRVEPERCLFPYETDDTLHEVAGLSGPITLVRFADGRVWRPFDPRFDPNGASRVLRRTPIGDYVEFEETDSRTGVVFTVGYALADSMGVVRHATLSLATDADPVDVEVLDGYRNIMPANVPLVLQQQMSTLVDAYKRSERIGDTGLAVYALEAAISDSPQAKESLRVNAVWRTGLEGADLLLTDGAATAFERGGAAEPTATVTGRRGAYLCRASVSLAPDRSEHWTIVADSHLDHAGVVSLRARLETEADMGEQICRALESDRERFATLLAHADAEQLSEDASAVAAHRSNVMFNAMRGGVPINGHDVSRDDFARFVRARNAGLAEQHRAFLNGLDESLRLESLAGVVRGAGDPHLERLALEYLPLTFGRRHGDPSRPWNRFRIRIRDEHGGRITGYEGNWRDIFQNWEAVCRSYPGMLPGVISKFFNATTAEGYNPYRINEQGIDWEVPEPHNPRSGIGYWGDHQIVYLHRLLEQCADTHPDWLASAVDRKLFTYAQVPYRFKGFDEIVDDPRNSLEFDEQLDGQLRRRASEIGGDGGLRLDGEGRPEMVTLLEKLLVPALAKVANLVPDGGVWMNTQRPEWNDANNALAGFGLSMVTLYQLRNYADWCVKLVDGLGEGSAELSDAIADWCETSNTAMVRSLESFATPDTVDDEHRWLLLEALGRAADTARQRIATAGPGRARSVERSVIGDFFRLTRHLCDHSIAGAKRSDGLFESYRVMHIGEKRAGVQALAPMLEGQVSVLASGVLNEQDSIDLLKTLFESELFREDQQTFILYPRVDLPAFGDRNVIDEKAAMASPLLSAALEKPDAKLIQRDAQGGLRFDADLTSHDDLQDRLDELSADPDWARLVREDQGRTRQVYEQTFRHARFTGRSGTMHKYEGLGSVYWHMVSKLLLAVQETAFRAADRGAPAEQVEELVGYYRRIRDGLGYRKSPWQFGAIPHEPYSHTPWGMAAQQPGMTGQVKEGVIARFGELGLRLSGGTIRFDPTLIDPAERLSEDRQSDEVDLRVPRGGIGGTVCGVPFVVTFGDSDRITVRMSDGSERAVDGREVPRDVCESIFARDASVSGLGVSLNAPV